ncbi:SPOR domain-containing protein [Hydrogenivirga sp.]
MKKLQGLQKHRLVLLLGILVALVFFYFGVNTWMESQQKQVAPPPVVRSKPPVQIKREAKPIKPIKPRPVQKPAPQVAQKPVAKPRPAKPQPKPVAQKPAPKPQKPVAKPQPKPAPQKQAKATKEQPKPQPKKEVSPKPVKTAKATPPKQKTEKKDTGAKLKDYVVQIGAFKVKANAEKRLKLAKQKGYEAFIIEEDGLHKVRVRVKANSLLSALKKVRSSFQNAFVVLR